MHNKTKIKPMNQTETKYVVLGSHMRLKRVRLVTNEDIILLSEEDYLKQLPANLHTPEVFEVISNLVMQGIYSFDQQRQSGWPKLQMGPTDKLIKELLCQKVVSLFKPNVVRLIEKLEIAHVYELILLNDLDLHKIRGLGISKRVYINSTLAEKGLTPSIIQYLRPVIKREYEMLIVKKAEGEQLIDRHKKMIAFISKLQL